MAAVTLTLVIVLAGVVYLRGWLQRRSIPLWRACSFFLGLLATWAVSRYLSDALFGAAPLDGSALVLVSLAFAAVAALATFVPGRRATNVDPIVALRCE